MAIKFCTKCGKKFESVGREVICPSCKQAAAEEARHAAVLRAKRASWTGESVPVRISGRASTLVRTYGKANGIPFAAALDDLLKASNYFKASFATWESIEPYKSRRMKKSGEQDVQDVPQVVQAASKPQVVQAAKVTSKASKQASKPQDAPQASKTAKVTSKK